MNMNMRLSFLATVLFLLSIATHGCAHQTAVPTAALSESAENAYATALPIREMNSLIRLRLDDLGPQTGVGNVRGLVLENQSDKVSGLKTS